MQVRSYIKAMFVRRFFSCLYACYRPYEQLLRMRLQMEEIVGAEGREDLF